MGELTEIAAANLKQLLDQVVADLHTRIRASEADFARRGVLRSSMHVEAVIDECCQAYDKAVLSIDSEIEWVMLQSLYVTKSRADELAEFGRVQLEPVTTECVSHYERVSKILKNSRFLAAFEQRLLDKRVSSEEAIALFIRRWRAENQRNVLRNLLSIILAPLKNPFRSS